MRRRAATPTFILCLIGILILDTWAIAQQTPGTPVGTGSSQGPETPSARNASNAPNDGFVPPDQPSAPPSLTFNPAKDTFRCERSFRYQGKIYSCDSVVRQDAEGLRQIIKDVPAAMTELDAYQTNRRIVRNAAYVGTLGVAIVLITTILGNQLRETVVLPDGKPSDRITPTGNVVRQLGFYGGFALTGGSLIWGLSVIRTNETHLNRAVQAYNQARPDQPIEILFTTGFGF